MTSRRFSPWAASAAVAVTVAIAAAIASLARVDATATGLPVVQLERAVVTASRPLPDATADAAVLPKDRSL